MRNRVLGLLGVVWGAIILLSRFRYGAPQGGDAYQSGQSAGLIFAGVLLMVGLFYLIRGSGFAGRSSQATSRRGPSARSAAAPSVTGDEPAAGSGRLPAVAEAALRWREPWGYRLRLRGDLGLRLLTAGGVWALATGVLCGLFAINVAPPGLGVAVFLGAVFGLGPAMILLFLRKPYVSGSIRADQAGLHRARVYAALTEMWAENSSWPYATLSGAVIIPRTVLGQPFSLLLLTTAKEAEIIALPQRLDRDALVRLLASQGVSVRVGQEIPPAWRRPLATPLAVGAFGVGLATLLGGVAFYLLRPQGQFAALPAPHLPEAPRPAAAVSPPLAVPAPSRDALPPAAASSRLAGGPPAANSVPPPPGAPGPGGDRPWPGTAPGALGVPPPGGPVAAGGGPAVRAAPRPALPGALATPRQPGDTALVGGPGGFPFRLAANTATPVLGFRYALGSWAGQPALALLEPLYGPPSPRPDVVAAREGYAVGALRVDATTLVSAVQVVFMKRLPDGRLDPGDSCTSDWIGQPSDRPPKVIGGDGQPVIGVHGRRGAVIDAIGLIRAPNP